MYRPQLAGWSIGKSFSTGVDPVNKIHKVIFSSNKYMDWKTDLK